MKISRSNENGSSLLISFVTAIVIGIFLVGYLRLASNQFLISTRSGTWNLTISMAEAGIEEGFTHLHTQGTTNLNSNGWTAEGTNFVKKTELKNGYYIVKISNDTSPVITSEGFLPQPMGSGYISRTIRVTTQSDSLFTKALVAKGTIDLQGNNITTDSFDSSDSNYSTGGRYDPAKIKANGDVATNLDLVNSISVGNANIKGRVSTGPGGTVAIGPSGAVGDLHWHNDGHTGIKDGWFSDDMNVSFPDVEAPYSGGAWSPGGGTLGGTNYAYILAGGKYQMSSLNMGNKETMLITGDSVLYVTGNVSLSGKSQIVIAPGASVQMYVAGPTTELGGNGVINPGSAIDFFYYGLPTNTSIAFSGNGDFTGVLYAPSADLVMNGGGSGYDDFSGAAVANTVAMNGHYNFHYDEFLGTLTGSRGFIITSWDEI